MNKTWKVVKYSQARQNWIESHNCIHAGECECGQPLSCLSSIFRHRKTKKHRDTMERLMTSEEGKVKIKERHDALHQDWKKFDAFYIKYPNHQRASKVEEN